MGYAVHHRDASGAMQLEDVESLDKALERVEQLRNAEGATEVRVFREVPIEVKTIYKVVALQEDAGTQSAAPPAASLGPVGGAEPPPGAMPLTPPLTARPAVAPAPEPVVEDPVELTDEPDLSADSPRRASLFNRG
jgi:hypothetical protein